MQTNYGGCENKAKIGDEVSFLLKKKKENPGRAYVEVPFAGAITIVLVTFESREVYYFLRRLFR